MVYDRIVDPFAIHICIESDDDSALTTYRNREIVNKLSYSAKELDSWKLLLFATVLGLAKLHVIPFYGHQLAPSAPDSLRRPDWLGASRCVLAATNTRFDLACLSLMRTGDWETLLGRATIRTGR